MRLFFQTVTINQLYKRKSSLRIYLMNRLSKKIPFTHKNNNSSEKRVSSDAFSAAMTIEASLILPIFLLVMMNIVWTFQILETDSRVAAATHQIEREMMIYGYAMSNQDIVSIDNTIGQIFSQGYIRNTIQKELRKDTYVSYCIGDWGINTIGSSILNGNGIVDLHINYNCQPFVSNYFLRIQNMGVRYYGHAFTGYDLENESVYAGFEDPVVYITKDGSVYHMNRNCSYLNPSVKRVLASTIQSHRNKDGAKYNACQLCDQYALGSICYITEYGESYHTALSCSGLKRTVYTVALSEVEGRACCSKCGQ